MLIQTGVYCTHHSYHARAGAAARGRHHREAPSMAHSTGPQLTAGARSAADARDARGAGGWRARIGVVIPSVNTVVEPWFSATSPAGVSVHASRMFLDNALTPESIVRMDQDEGMRAVRQLASCRPHGIAYCCTASSIVQGLEYDRHLQHEVEQAAGVPATTATQSILEALRVLCVKRIAAASPYAEEIDRAEHAFFEAAGFEVVSSACLGIKDAFGLAALRCARFTNWRCGRGSPGQKPC